EPAARVGLDFRQRLRGDGPVVERAVAERDAGRVAPPDRGAVDHRDVAAHVRAREKRHPEMARRLLPVVVLAAPEDAPADPHAAQVVDRLAEEREADGRDAVWTVLEPLRLADEELVVDPPV